MSRTVVFSLLLLVAASAVTAEEYPSLYGSSGTAFTLSSLTASGARVVLTIMESNPVVALKYDVVTSLQQHACSAELPAADTAAFTTISTTKSFYFAATASTLADMSQRWFCLVQASAAAASTAAATLTTTSTITVADAAASTALAGLVADNAYQLVKVTGSDVVTKMVITGTTTGMTYGCAIGTTGTAFATSVAATWWFTEAGATTADNSVVWWCVFKRTSTDNSAATVTPTGVASLTVADAGTSGALAGLTAANSLQLLTITASNLVSKLFINTPGGATFACNVAAVTSTAFSTSASFTAVDSTNNNWITDSALTTADGSVTWYCMWSASATANSVSTVLPTKAATLTFAASADHTSTAALSLLTATGAQHLLKISSGNIVMRQQITAGQILTNLVFHCAVDNTGSTTAAFSAVASYIYATGSSSADGSATWFCLYQAGAVSSDAKIAYQKYAQVAATDATATSALADLDAQGANVLVVAASSNMVVKVVVGTGITTNLSHVCAVQVTSTAATAATAANNWAYIKGSASIADGSVTWYCIFERGSSDNTAVIVTATKTSSITVGDATASAVMAGLTAQLAAQVVTYTASNMVAVLTATGTSAAHNYACQETTFATILAGGSATVYLYTKGGSTADGAVSWLCQYVANGAAGTSMTGTMTKVATVTSSDTIASGAMAGLSAQGSLQLATAASSNLVTKLVLTGTTTAMTYFCAVGATSTGATNTATDTPIWQYETAASIADGSVTWYCLYTRAGTDNSAVTLTSSKQSTISAADTIASGAVSGLTAQGAVQLVTAGSSNLVTKLVLTGTTTAMTYFCAVGATSTGATNVATATPVWAFGQGNSIADGSVTWYCLYTRAGTDNSAVTITSSKATTISASDTIASSALSGLTAQGAAQLVTAGSSNMVAKIVLTGTTTAMTYLCDAGATSTGATNVATSTPVYVYQTGGSTADGSVTWYCLYTRAGTDNSAVTVTFTKTATIAATDAAATTAFAGLAAQASQQIVTASASNLAIKVVLTGTTTAMTYTCNVGTVSTGATNVATSTPIWTYGAGASTADGSVTWFCMYHRAGTDNSAVTATITKGATATHSLFITVSDAYNFSAAKTGEYILTKITASNMVARMGNTAGTVTNLSLYCAANSSPTTTSAGTTPALVADLSAHSTASHLIATGASTADASVSWWCLLARGATATTDSRFFVENFNMIAVANAAAATASTQLDIQNSLALYKLASSSIVVKLGAATTTDSATYGCSVDTVPTAYATAVAASKWVFATGSSTADGGVTWYCVYKRATGTNQAMVITPTKATLVTAANEVASTAFTFLTAQGAYQHVTYTSTSLATSITHTGTTTGMTYDCLESKTPTSSATSTAAVNYHWSAGSSTADTSLTWFCVYTYGTAAANSSVTGTANATATILAVPGTSSFALYGLTATGQYHVVKFSEANTVNKIVLTGTTTGMTYDCDIDTTPTTVTTTMVSTVWEAGAAISKTRHHWFCVFKYGGASSAAVTALLSVVTMLGDVDGSIPAFTDDFPVVISGSTTATILTQLSTAGDEGGGTEAGFYYWQVSSSSTAPSTAQIKNLQDATGAALTIGGRGGSVTITNANTTYTASVSNLNASTTFILYSYSVDDFSNTQAVSTISFATRALTTSGGVEETYMTSAAAAGATTIVTACGTTCGTNGWVAGGTCCIGFTTSSTYECHTISSVSTIALSTALTYAHTESEPVTGSASSTSAGYLVHPSVFVTVLAMIVAVLLS